jgi:hypothetical protein
MLSQETDEATRLVQLAAEPTPTPLPARDDETKPKTTPTGRESWPRFLRDAKPEEGTWHC